MKQNRIITVLLILLSFIIVTVPEVYATPKGTVYSKTISILEAKKEFTVPVYIKNAPSLMGFKLHFTLNDKSVDIYNVESTELTKNGFFNHNADVHDTAFDVIWAGTSKLSEDGKICILKGNCIKNFSEIEIKVNYSKQDTFDEKYKDIELECESIFLRGNKYSENHHSSRVIKSDDTLKQAKNSNDSSSNVSNNESIKKELLNSSNSSSILNEIQIVNDKFGINKPTEIPNEKKKLFLKKIGDRISGFNSMTASLKSDEKIQLIEDLYNTLKQGKDLNKENDSNKTESSNNSYRIVLLILSLIALSAIIVLFIRRIKNESQ